MGKSNEMLITEEITLAYLALFQTCCPMHVKSQHHITSLEHNSPDRAKVYPLPRPIFSKFSSSFVFQGTRLQIRCSSGLAGYQVFDEKEAAKDGDKEIAKTGRLQSEFELVFDEETKPFSSIELAIVLRAKLGADVTSWEQTYHKVSNKLSLLHKNSKGL